jgi:hypothetical protein
MIMAYGNTTKRKTRKRNLRVTPSRVMDHLRTHMDEKVYSHGG